MHGQQERYGSRWLVVLLLLLIIVIGYLARLDISVALPFISKDYSWSQGEHGMLGGFLLGSFLISYGLSNIFLSPLVDLFGSKKSLVIAIFLWSISTSIGAIFGQIYGIFIISRIFLGIGQGILFPIASKIIQGLFPLKERSRANASYQSGGILASFLAPLLLVPLIMMSSWRLMFHFIALIGFALTIFVWIYLQDIPKQQSKSEKNRGSKFISGWRKDLESIIKKRELWILIIAASCETIAWWGVILWLPTYLIEAQGFTVEQMRFGAAVPYLAGLAGIFLGSWISDRTGRHINITIGAFLATALFFVFATLTQTKSQILIVLSLMMFFLATVGPNVFTILQFIIPKSVIGSGTGLLNGISNISGTLGPIVIGMVFTLTGAYNFSLIIIAAVLIVGAVSLILLSKMSFAKQMKSKKKRYFYDFERTSYQSSSA